jgi:hypothetical protein
VPPGYVGIKVDLYGEKKGVGNEVLSVGRYRIGVGEELFVFRLLSKITFGPKALMRVNKLTSLFRFRPKRGFPLTETLGSLFTSHRKK